MTLVIDIPCEIRKAIFDDVYCGIADKRVYDAIKNGISLPEGHSFIAICDSDFQMTEEAENILKDTFYMGNDDCDYCFDIAAIIPTNKEKE